MNKQQTLSFTDRIIYSVVLWIALRASARWGWFSADDAAWIALGAVMLAGGVIDWIRNRPQNLLSRAATTLPKESGIVIVPPPSASHAERARVEAIADASSAQVIAKT